MVSVAWQCVPSLTGTAVRGRRPRCRHLRERRRHRMEAVQGGTGVCHVYRAQWRFHPELRRTLPQRRADQYGVCGIDGELRGEQTHGEEATNAVEQAWGPLTAPDPYRRVKR